MNNLRLTRCRLGSEVFLVIFVVVMVTGILLTLVIMWPDHVIHRYFSYAIASLRDDVRATWPYIRWAKLWCHYDVIVTIVTLVTILLKDVSLLYSVVLEQCLVSIISLRQLLLTMVTIGFIIVHIYFKHVMKIVDHRWFRLLNYIALYAGFTSAYGLILVGSFQVTKISTSLIFIVNVLKNKTQLSDLHYFGAVLAFGVGSFYCCVVTVISWHMAVIRKQRMLLIIVRIFMCVCLIGGIITCK